MTATIRRLRFELAQALADAEPEHERLPDALEEFDRVLGEPGADPPDAEIHLAVARVLETVHPPQAMLRYLEAVVTSSSEAALGRALAMLERSNVPGSLLSPVSDHVVEQIRRLALDSVGEYGLLAAALLRDRRRDADAAEVLQRAYDAGVEPRAALTARLAETLLDLDQIEKALLIIQDAPGMSEDVGLVVTYAQALLMWGKPYEALAALADLSEPEAQRPAAAAVAALALLGLGRLDDARERLPHVDAPELHFARAVLHLSAREYAAAQEASWALVQSRPNDVETLLVNAQPPFEGLGETQIDDELGSASFESNDVVAARALLEELAGDLSEGGPHSRWWGMQYAVRQYDGRFRYFEVELRCAAGTDMTLEDLDAVDSAHTTWHQDSAVAELKAKLLDAQGEPERAADAYDEAVHLAGELAGDERRAASLARHAYDRMPTLVRAMDLSERAAAASPEMGDDEARDLLAAALKAAEQAFPDADDDNAQRLANAIAWVRLRTSEYMSDFGRAARLDAMPWLLAGLVAQPSDSVLRAFIASMLGDLDLLAPAQACAARAFARDPDNAYVAEAAVVAASNYTADLPEMHAILARHPSLSEQDDWVNAIELSCYLGMGDRDGIRACLSGPASSAQWALQTRALAVALVDGASPAKDELTAMLDDLEAGAPGSYPVGAVAAAAIGDREMLRTIARSAADSSDLSPQRRDWVGLVERFALEEDMTPNEFLEGSVRLCKAPDDLLFTVNVALPILDAARAQLPGPAPVVPVDEEIVARRSDGLRAELRDWPAELEAIEPGVGALARLADPEAFGLGELVAVEGEVGRLERPCLKTQLPRLARLAVAEEASNIPHAVVEAALGRRPSVADDDIRVVLDEGFPLPAAPAATLVLLADAPDRPGPADATAAAIVDFMSDVAREAPLEPDEWWRLDDALERSKPRFPELVTDVRAGMIAVLAESFGFGAGFTRPEHRRPLKFSIGGDLLPADPGSEWRMFTELLPHLRDRVEDDTGVMLPSCAVTSESHRRDGLRMFLYDAPLRSLTVPTRGWIVPDEHGELTDPLSGRRMRVVEGSIRPTGAFDPLEFVMRHVERFCRDHIAEFLTVWDVQSVAAEAGADVAQQVTSDARLLREWLGAIRDAVARGERYDPSEFARRLSAGSGTSAIAQSSGYT